MVGDNRGALVRTDAAAGGASAGAPAGSAAGRDRYLDLLRAAALVRVIDALLFGVSPYDPGTFTLVAAIVLGVGLVATLIPAYRATRVDPIVTLRAE